MVDGPNQYSGRIEVYNSYRNRPSGYLYPQDWGTMCEVSQWTVEDATVVCRSLGYSFSESNLRTNESYGVGTGPIWTSRMYCSGREYYTWECPVSYNQGFWCNHSMDLGITCSGMNYLYVYIHNYVYDITFHTCMYSLYLYLFKSAMHRQNISGFLKIFYPGTWYACVCVYV